MTVIQTGAIAGGGVRVRRIRLARSSRSGGKSTAIWAAIGVVALTGLNLAGTLQSKVLQKVMEILLIAALVVDCGRRHRDRRAPAQAGRRPAPAAASFGLAMIFVLLTYGGWNEARLPRGRGARRAAQHGPKVLVGGILAVTVLYLLVNLRLLRGARPRRHARSRKRWRRT